MADFEELSREAERRGIGLMLDMVFNHTSTQHEWFQKALAGDPKYKDYYIWRKGRPDGAPPTNWRANSAAVPGNTSPSLTNTTSISLTRPRLT